MNRAAPAVVTARLTPYELLLEPLEIRDFPAIRDEAEARGVDPRRRDQLLLLAHAGIALGEMIPDDAPADAMDEYGELLYQGFQFWAFGRRLYVLGDSVTTQLLAPHYSFDGWLLAAPPACYIQLPYQRLWARVAAEAPYEPVDGCFVVVDETAPAPEAGAHLRALMVLGLRTERPGISLVSYRTDLDPHHASRFAAEPWREDAAPFANALPGGERRGYHTLATTSELEALILRTFHWLDTKPLSMRAEEGSISGHESRLPHVMIESQTR